MTTVYLNMLSSLKPFHCPSCDSNFSNRDTARLHAVTRYPLLLDCGHTLCESCIRNQAKSKSLVCTVCKTSVDMPNGEQSISQLSPDLHVLGVLSANLKKSLPSLKMKMVPMSTSKQMSNREFSTVVCENCSHTQAVWRCDKCEQNFCDSCFDHIHARVKSMRKHEGKKICADIYDTMVQEGCTEHKRPIEYFCQEDNHMACSYCVVMGDHKGHDVLTLQEKNTSCAVDLQNALEEAQVVQKRFKYTERKINETIPLAKIDSSGLMKQVHDHFHTLHALLQLREAELISHLERISNTNTSLLEKMRAEISVYEKDLISVVRDAEAVIKNPCLAVSAADIIKKLEESKTLPCVFMPVSHKTESTIGIELDLNSNLEEILSKHGKINADIKPKYCLLPSNLVPEDVIELGIDSLTPSVGDSGSVISNQETFSEDSLASQPNSDHSSSVMFKSCDFVSLQQEQVVISHIKSPTIFYAQRCSESRKLKALSENINRWCRSVEARRDRSQSVEVEKGDLYLVQYSGDSLWYRGRVLKIFDQPNTKQLDDDDDQVALIGSGKSNLIKSRELKVEVLYIDYGNSEIVSKSKLRNIQTRFLNLPSMARRCSLWDIVPCGPEGSQQNDWSEEATRTFAKFVGKRPVILQIREERNNILYVDLSQCASDDISNDVPVSVRDALVFLEHGCFPSGNRSDTRPTKSLRQFIPPEQLLVNVNINAIISHVEGPSLFYVQQMSTARYLSELIFEMQNTYNDDLNTMLHGIYVPYVGMICAAQFRVDSQWYRAQVLSLPGGSMIEVQYVDFGNKEVIHYKSLRKLFDKFCKLNVQAIPCMLADVSNSGAKWPKEATQWLTKKGSKKQLTLKAHGIEPGEKLTKVALYDIEDEFEICINALMVEEYLAVSTGPLSRVVRTPLATARTKIPSPIPGPPPPDIEEPVAQSKSETKSKKVEIARPAPETSKQVKVFVSHIVNPGFFYIRLTGKTEERLNGLMEDLQMIYENLEDEILDLKEDQHYAVFSENKQKWYRATTMAILPEDKVKVRYVDYGFEEEVHVKSLRNILQKLCLEQSFAVRCHLSGIIPAGGSTQWSHMSCDAFQQLVAPHETLYLVSKGTVDKEIKSLPSDLMAEELVRGGALEPTKYITYSITSKLIEKGVALPVRKEKKPSSVTNLKESVMSPEGSVSGSKCPSICSDSDSTVTSEHSKEAPPKPKRVTRPLTPQKPKFQWKPAILPTQQKFLGTVTNIGDDGCIQLHIVQRGSSLVDVIKKAMQCKYDNCPYEYVRLPPAVGEACMAKFLIDKMWYRAEVLATYTDKIKVNFVDYGNSELVSLMDIRTDIIMTDLPRQCLECRLPGIKPANGETWGKRILDFLHETLVEQTCMVQLLGEPEENGILPSKIASPSGIDVSELLLSMGVAVPIEEAETAAELASCLASPKEKEASSEMASFQDATKFPEKNYFPVCVTQLFEPNIVCIQWLETSNPRYSNESQRNDELQEFLQLIQELRAKANTFPKIESPKPGMVCCAKYSFDNNWYRCEISDVVKDGIKILYVDYGNSETIPTAEGSERLRRLSPEFLNLPVQVRVCQLHGMKPTGKDWDTEVNSYLGKVFFSSEKEIFAKVVIPEKIPEIHLYVKNENDEMEIAYSKLVNDGLISIEFPTSEG